MSANVRLDVGQSIPAGYVLGRLSGGVGPAQLIPIQQLAGQVANSGLVMPAGASGSSGSTTVVAGTAISVSVSGTAYTVSGAYTAGTGITITGASIANSGVLSLTAPAAGFGVSSSTGAITFTLNHDLSALEALSTTGLAARTATDTWTTRTITGPAAGISVSNGDGVSGNPTLALANDLAALEALAGTGIAARTAADTWAQRTITGTSARLSVSNGDGVSGNPTLDIDAAYVGQSSITTLGTVGTGTWQGTVITGQFGGTGVANTGKTITLGGNLTTSGAFATTLTVSAATNSTLPAGTHTLAGLDVAQTWSAAQSYNSGDLKLNGATSGAITVNAAAVAGSNTITLPAGTTDFSATGGTSQVVKQTSAGGALTVGQLVAADLSDYASWTSYTPTIASGSGTLTSVTGNMAQYIQVGNFIAFQGQFTITTNGTGGAFITVTLPVVASFSGGFGRYTDGISFGFSLQVAPFNTTTIALEKYDGSYPGGNGYSFFYSGIIAP